jgi:hypothetical protein
MGPGAGIGPEGTSVTRTLETPIVVLKPGSLVAGKYKIIDEVGAGGMGVACKAEDLRLKRHVALKQLADQRMRIANDPERIAAFERGLAEGGYEGAQRAIADVLAARYWLGRYFDAMGVAMRYLDAGDKDRAIEWLYKSYADHDQNLPYIGTSEWAPLRGDPRFQALLRMIGLPLEGSGSSGRGEASRGT